MINLHINLLLDAERRSSSRISRKFICFLAAGAALMLFLAAVFISYIGAYSARQQLRFAEQEKTRLEPVYKSITLLCQELIELQNSANAITAWAQSRSDWPRLLLCIQTTVPPNVQLTRLTVNETINLSENVPSRVMTLYIRGKATGEHSEKDVQQLEKDLKEKKPFNAVMETAEVKQFEADKNRAYPTARLFDLECRFKPIKLFQPVKIKPPEAK